MSEDSDPGSESSEEEYDHEFMGNAADRARLAAMTEVEREAVIYERKLARQKREEKRQLKRKLEMHSGKQGRLERLRQKRMKEKYESEDEYELSPDEEEEVFEPCTFEQVHKLQTKRSRLVKYLHNPVFESLACGTFVRIAVTANTTRIGTIKSFVEGKEYTLEQYRTKRKLLCSLGEFDRKFPFSSVSNTSISREEFDKWVNFLKSNNAHLPSKKELEIKIENAKKMQSSALSEDQMHEMLTKREVLPASNVSARAHIDAKMNFCIKKEKELTEKLADLEEKALNSDYEGEDARREADNVSNELSNVQSKMVHYRVKIAELEAAMKQEQSSHMEKKKSWSKIAKRNKKLNLEGMRIAEKEKAIKDKEMASRGEFSRRKCMPTVIHGKIEDSQETQAASPQEETLDDDFELDIQVEETVKIEPANVNLPSGLNLEKYKQEKGLF